MQELFLKKLKSKKYYKGKNGYQRKVRNPIATYKSVDSKYSTYIILY